MIATDRFKAAIAAVLAELLPNRRFFAPVEYTIVTAAAGKFSARPTNSKVYPEIDNAEIRGLPGANAASILLPGTSVLVSFIEGDRSRPVLVSVLEAPAVHAQTATLMHKITAPQIVLNEGVQPVARVGDLVMGIFPITSGSPTFRSG
jgi:hypothetical protein